MKIRDIIAPLEEFAPLGWQEEYDNSGLVAGRLDDDVEGAVICVDATAEVLDEAERLGARLVISHHPVIFRPIKRLTGQSHTEQVVERAIRGGIALYAAHTNLDSAPGGMSFRLAKILGVEDPELLTNSGNENRPHGFGVIGTLPHPTLPQDYLRQVKRALGLKVIRHGRLTGRPIDRVALCSGSAAPLIPAARESGAELFMAADFKYNDFFAHGETDANHPFMVADLGHFESEFCAIDLIHDVISKKTTNFALHKSANSRNPVEYLI
jgi:dinuclear metal center YbgI/SA1388 family protein